jgi:hypothetical protein
MTDALVIQMVAADPLVIERNSRRLPDGSVQLPSAAELQTRATQCLSMTVGLILNDQSIARQLRVSSHLLTTVSGTSEYTLPGYIGRPISIRKASGYEPVTLLGGIDEFDQWKYEQNAGTTDPTWPMVACLYGREGGTGAWILLIDPASAASLRIRYLVRPVEPFGLASLPPEVHGTVALAVLNRMAGGALQGEVDLAMRNMRRAIGPAASAVHRRAYAGDTQCAIDDINAGRCSVSRSSLTGYHPI